LQGLYQDLVGGNEPWPTSTCSPATWRLQKADSVHFDALLQGCVAQAAQLDALIMPLAGPPDGGDFPH
jgi:N utilization substance protein B